MIGKIDFWLADYYGGHLINNDPVYASATPFLTIPGSDVISIDSPTLSIKPTDSYFANDTQTIKISVTFSSDYTGLLNMGNLYNEQWDHDQSIIDDIVICVYDVDNNRVFDGVLTAGNRSFDIDSMVIEFELQDLLYIAKSYLTETNYNNTNVLSISTTIETILNEAFKRYSGWRNSPSSRYPMKYNYDNGNRPFKNFDDYEIYRNAEMTLSDNSYNWHYYSLYNTSTDTFKNRMYIVYIEYYAEWKVYIFRYDYKNISTVTKTYLGVYGLGSSYSNDEIVAIISPLESGHTVMTDVPITNYGATLTGLMERSPSGGGYAIYMSLILNGDYYLNDISIKANQKAEDVVKFILFAKNWKLLTDKNNIQLTNASEWVSGGDVLTINHNRVSGLKLDFISFYDPIDTSICDILDADAATITLFKNTLSSYYDGFLKNSGIEYSFSVKKGTDNITIGTPITIPAITGVISEIKCRVYEISQNTDNPDWYDVKAYNINF